MTAVTAPVRPASPRAQQWAALARRAPVLAATMTRYLGQIALSSRPGTVVVADGTLRRFAAFLVDHDLKLRRLRDVNRGHVEAYKRSLRERAGKAGKPLSNNTIRQGLGMLRTFFERIIEWGYPDAPARVPVFAGDLPKADDPLPRFLDDARATRLLRAAVAEPDGQRRLVIELLARTGLRVSELCALERDCVHHVNEHDWLRVPLGKLHNDRYIPLHPDLVPAIRTEAARRRPDEPALLFVRDGRRLNRHRVTRMLNRVAKAAGVGHVHPHQLRHTLATQAINRGMSLDAVAAMLGHRSLRMTLVYARMADRTVADQYQEVTAKVEAAYAPVEQETGDMRRLRHEMTSRLLGNGYCTRPRELDCTFESICENCAHYQTGPEFLPILIRQRDHAQQRDQRARTQLFDRIVNDLEQNPPSGPATGR